MRYLMVGGSGYFRNYKGTGVYTGLKIYGSTDQINKIQSIIDIHYDECGGLFTIIDCETGTEYLGYGE